MGLDQFGYAINKNGEKSELAYWRKHPNLQGWMENLWEDKGRPGLDQTEENSLGDFNCIPVELTLKNLELLEKAVKSDSLPETEGFFFGSNSDNKYKEQDLEFIKKAKQAIEDGSQVFYDSWW